MSQYTSSYASLWSSYWWEPLHYRTTEVIKARVRCKLFLWLSKQEAKSLEQTDLRWCCIQCKVSCQGDTGIWGRRERRAKIEVHLTGLNLSASTEIIQYIKSISTLSHLKWNKNTSIRANKHEWLLYFSIFLPWLADPQMFWITTPIIPGKNGQCHGDYYRLWQLHSNISEGHQIR